MVKCERGLKQVLAATEQYNWEVLVWKVLFFFQPDMPCMKFEGSPHVCLGFHKVIGFTLTIQKPTTVMVIALLLNPSGVGRS